MSDRYEWRCFFVLGLCNNFAYSVTMSAAVDILTSDTDTTPVSTGIVFAANVAPGAA